jgi:hypothetical protein
MIQNNEERAAAVDNQAADNEYDIIYAQEMQAAKRFKSNEG